MIYGLFLSRYNPRVLADDLKPINPAGFYDYAGVMNIHTKASSGSGTPEEVILAAQESGVDFLIFTDLNGTTFEETYNNNVLVMLGSEYRYLDSRILNFDSSREETLHSAGRTQVMFANLLSEPSRSVDQGMFILAHPLKPGYEWSGEYPVGLDAIEVFNLKAIWQWSYLNDKGSFAWTLITYPFNPALAFARLFAESSKNEIALWDGLNRKRKVIGFVGSDAESRVSLLGKTLEVPSYRTLFSIMKNHVLLTSELTGSLAADHKKVASALRSGQFYMSLDLFANPRGFNAYVQDSGGKIFPLGSSVRKGDKNLELVVQLPSKPLVQYQVQVYRDGEKVLTSSSVKTVLPIRESGSYRIVVRLRVVMPLPDGRMWIPWIYTNPINVKF